MGKQKYDEQYQRHAVTLVESGRSKAEVARELNISDHLIYSWCKKYGSGGSLHGNGSSNQDEVTHQAFTYTRDNPALRQRCAVLIG